jgi:hypothetical protein
VDYDVTIPVTVTINKVEYVYDLTWQFTYGLLLFSFVSNIKYDVKILGAPLSFEEYPTYNDSGQYRIEYNKGMVEFFTPQFMRGFATGAGWAEVDHHDYWTKLYEYDESMDVYDEITF